MNLHCGPTDLLPLLIDHVGSHNIKSTVVTGMNMMKKAEMKGSEVPLCKIN